MGCKCACVSNSLQNKEIEMCEKSGTAFDEAVRCSTNLTKEAFDV
jgi:hypothetical protein